MRKHPTQSEGTRLPSKWCQQQQHPQGTCHTEASLGPYTVAISSESGCSSVTCSMHCVWLLLWCIAGTAGRTSACQPSRLVLRGPRLQCRSVNKQPCYEAACSRQHAAVQP